MKLRMGLAGAGVLVALWGVWKLITAVDLHGLIRLPLWLGGAVVADDLLLVPLTVAVGWVLSKWARGRVVGAVRTTLLYVGVTSLLALPLLLRQGTGANPTILPRNYLRDWLLLEAIIIVVGALSALRSGRRGPRPEPSADAERA
jgi:hypothetical protein